MSNWNPSGSETNCMACVARYLRVQIKGTPVDDATSSGLELLSQPQTVQGHAPTLSAQKRNAVLRTKTIIESVGLKEADRYDAYLGQTKYVAGHYAVIGLDSGHVICGEVERSGSDFNRLFCPQTDRLVTLGSLNGRALALRFIAA